MTEEHELIKELLYKNSSEAREEINRILKENKILRTKIIQAVEGRDQDLDDLIMQLYDIVIKNETSRK